jgi:hypothetical protein
VDDDAGAAEGAPDAEATACDAEHAGGGGAATGAGQGAALHA